MFEDDIVSYYDEYLAYNTPTIITRSFSRSIYRKNVQHRYSFLNFRLFSLPFDSLTCFSLFFYFIYSNERLTLPLHVNYHKNEVREIFRSDKSSFFSIMIHDESTHNVAKYLFCDQSTTVTVYFRLFETRPFTCYTLFSSR